MAGSVTVDLARGNAAIMLGGIGFLATQTLGCRVGSCVVASGFARSMDRGNRLGLTVKAYRRHLHPQLLPLRGSRLVPETTAPAPRNVRSA